MPKNDFNMLTPRSARSSTSKMSDKLVRNPPIAPSHVKFYKYEELKEKLKLQNEKDLRRQKLKNSLKY